MITIKTKALKRKKPDGTGWEYQPIYTFNLGIKNEMETCTPRQRKLVTKVVKALSELLSLETFTKAELEFSHPRLKCSIGIRKPCGT